MKMKTTGILAVTLIAGLFLASAYGETSLVNQQKEKDKAIIEQLKSKIKSMQKEIIEKNHSYMVGITTVTKMKIHDITGARPPVGLAEKAKVQRKKGLDLFEEYLKRIDRKQRRYFERIDEEIADDSSKDLPEESGSDEIKDEDKPADTDDATPKKKDDATPEKKDDPTPKKKDDATPSGPDANLPDPSASHFTWADRKVMTPVKFQAMCGSCWSFTSAAVMEGSANKSCSTVFDLSEQSILDCSRGRSGQKAGSCNGGWFGDVFDYYMTTSPVSETAAPYTGRDSVCMKRTSEKIKVAAWGYIRPDAGIPDVKAMKAAICKYGSIAAAVKVTDHFQSYTGGIFDEFAPTSGKADINHAITIVGWDDEKKAYLLKNSWGTDWGENGYMWIRYDCNNVGYGAAWVVMEQTK
jgi:C1A family cysteine protease